MRGKYLRTCKVFTPDLKPAEVRLVIPPAKVRLVSPPTLVSPPDLAEVTGQQRDLTSFVTKKSGG